MKRILILVLAIICGVSFSDSFAKKPKKKVAAQDEQAILDSLHKAEIRRLELEMQQEEERRRAALEEQKKAVMEMEEEMPVPCSQEAKSDDEYYGVLGIGEGHSMSNAMIDAIQKAQLELIKLVGEELETNKIDKVCQIYFQNKYGVFNVYVALKYPKKKK